MNEIDVTKVTAIEYLEKLIKISKEEVCDCDYEDDCDTCRYNHTSCASIIEIAFMGVENHIKGVMAFELPEPKIDWTKVKKDTLIEVKDGKNERWDRRYFNEYKDGKVWAYLDGRTSKTEVVSRGWNFARLAEED
jgi:hypothetical protein|nr:MAG TPA: hypothetical protein [Caudoviricetes sp.]